MPIFAAMKRLFYFFSFYILFLSGVPCSPYDRCCVEELQSVAATGQPGQKDPNSSTDHKSDFPCSPFFACGGNHGIVIPNLRIQFVQPQPPQVRQSSYYTERPLLVFVPSIWQPPKSA